MYDVVQIGTDCGEMLPDKDVGMSASSRLIVDNLLHLGHYRAVAKSNAKSLVVKFDGVEDLDSLLPEAKLYVIRLALLRLKDAELARQLLLSSQRKAKSLQIRLLNMAEQPQLTERGLRLAWSTWPELTSPLTCLEVLGMLTDNQRTLKQDGEISASVQSGALLRHFRSVQVVSVNDPPNTRYSTRAQTLLPEREGQLKIPIPLTYRLEASV